MGEFVNIVSKRNKLQDMNINQLKLELNDSFKKDEKITTNFEPTNDSDALKEAYLDEKLSKKNWSHMVIRKPFPRV